MIITWMAYATLLGALTALAAEALHRGARSLRRPSRFIWMAAMLVTVFAPLIAYLVVRWQAIHSKYVSMSLAGPLSPVPVSDFVTINLHQPTGLMRLVGIWNQTMKGTDRAVLGLWAALTLLLLVRLVMATAALWRRRSQWRSAVVHDVPVRMTEDLGPAVVAIPASEILLPEWVMSLDDAEVRTIIRHEREHREAGDARLLLAGATIIALMPWNAALWFVNRRLRLAVEMDCDARVLRHEPKVDRYGSLLLAISQRPRTMLLGSATLAESTSDLERRIDAMTAPRPASKLRAALVSASLAVVAIAFACATPAPDVVVSPLAAKDTFSFTVNRPARPTPDNIVPEYPAQLRAANIEGTVIGKFVVDTNGRAIVSSLVIVKSDHALFTSAVREALPKMTFVPAELGGRKVKQLFTMPFVFSISGSASAATSKVAVDKPKAARHDSSYAVEIPPASTNPMRETLTLGPLLVHRVTDTVPAALNSFPPPTYPKQLRAANIEGEVIMQFLVKPDGFVEPHSIKVVKSDHPLFEGAAMKALLGYKFIPARVSGTAVPWVTTMPFGFSLSK